MVILMDSYIYVKNIGYFDKIYWLQVIFFKVSYQHKYNLKLLNIKIYSIFS